MSMVTLKYVVREQNIQEMLIMSAKPGILLIVKKYITVHQGPPVNQINKDLKNV